jgi:hypothetical protein
VTRYLKWAAVGIAIVVVLAVAALAAVPYLVDTPRIQSLIATSASQALGRPVRFASVSVSVLPRPSVVLKSLEVAEDPAFGPTPFLRLNEAVVRLRLWPLLLGRVELGDFILKKPAISLVQAPDGRWNFASLGGAAEPRTAGRPRSGSGGAGAAAALGSRVKIEDGVVTYEARGGPAGARYRVEDLDLALSGGSGAVTFQGDARVMPGDLTVKIGEGSVGLTAGRPVGDAALRGRLSLDGRQVRELAAVAIGPEPALSGALKGTLTLGGTVGRPRATGEVTLNEFAVSQVQAQCPEPKRRTLAVGPLKAPIAWEEPRFTARPLTTTLGGGSVSANVTAILDRGVRLELADLALKGIPAEKVLVDYLCQGYAVTGPLDLTGRAATRLGELLTSLDGAGRLRLGPGRVVGPQALALLGQVVRVGGAVSAVLGSEMPALTAGAPLDYESITATYTINDGVLSTRDLLFTSRTLKTAVAGTYALATGAVKADVTLTAAGREIKGTVTGTAASPSIRVAPESVVRGVDQEKVEKGLRDLLKRYR